MASSGKVCAPTRAQLLPWIGRTLHRRVDRWRGEHLSSETLLEDRNDLAEQGFEEVEDCGSEQEGNCDS